MKKSLILVFLLTALTASADNWTPKASFTFGQRFGQASFSINGLGYFCAGGSNTAFFNDLWEYNPTTNSWTQKATLPAGSRESPTCLAIGNKGYVGMGYGSGNLFFTDWWEYDPTNDSWLQKADYPGEGGVGISGCVGFSIGGKGYVGTGGGWSTGHFHNSNEFWEYDTSTDIWTQKANFGGKARWYAVGFAIGNKGYVGTGESIDSLDMYYNDFWEYDPSLDIWTQKATFGGAKRADAAGFSIGNWGFIGIGDSAGFAGTTDNDFWEYNPLTDSWSQKANYPGGGGAGVYEGLCFTIGTKGYIGGGGAPSTVAQSDFWEYSPDSITGIPEISKNELSLITFPNPFSCLTTFKSETELNNAEIKVFDITGRQIKICSGINGRKYTLNCDDMTSGIYSYQLTEDKNIIATGEFDKQ